MQSLKAPSGYLVGAFFMPGGFVGVGFSLIGSYMPDELVKSVRGIFGYGGLLLIMMSVWGGTAAYISKVRLSHKDFSVAELFGEWVISGFSGLVTAFICNAYGVDVWITYAAAGISGHMGGRAIYVLERLGCQYIKSKIGVSGKTLDGD